MDGVQSILDLLEGVRQTGGGWSAKCPAHDDQQASLSVSEGDGGRVLMHCHAGCGFDAICESLNLKPADLMGGNSISGPRPKPKVKTATIHPTREKAVAAARWMVEQGWNEKHNGKSVKLGDPDYSWCYPDAAECVFEVLRWQLPDGEKAVCPIRPVPGGWSTTRPEGQLPLLCGRDLAAVNEVVIVEGEIKVDQARSLGFAAACSAFGANSASRSDWSQLAGKSLVILPDNDDPGRKYADDVARIVTALSPPARVRIVQLPLLSIGGDLVNWVNAGGTREELLELIDAATYWEPADDVDDSDDSDDESDSEKPPKKTQSQELVELCLDLYDLFSDDAGEPFAVLRGGPNLAIMLRGRRDALRQSLAREYRRRHGRVPSSSALADALLVIAGEAAEHERRSVYLRVAEHDGGVVIDLGDQAGRAVVVRPGSWEVVERSPVLFRRTAMTSELVEPTRPGNVELLRELVNLDDESWRLAVCWLVAALIPWIGHPILLLGGEQGTGKTTAAILLLGIIDKSPAPVTSQPKDPDSWAIAACGAWCIGIDNVSTIPGWLSDAWCRAVTGDGWVRRTLYSDSDLTVLSFRRVLALTSIDSGALRGDLADRLLMIELQPIGDRQRRAESDLLKRYDEIAGQLFAGLLDLLSQVLERLPTIQLDSLPRMADFARVVAAVDPAALKTYLGQRDRLAVEVLDSDPIAGPIVDLVESSGGWWAGSCGELREALIAADETDSELTGKRGRDSRFPKTAKAMRGALARIAPALRRTGIDVEFSRGTDRQRKRLVRLTKEVGFEPSEQSEPSEVLENKASECGRSADDCGRSADDCTSNRPTDSPDKTRRSDVVDDVDGWPTLSSDLQSW